MRRKTDNPQPHAVEKEDKICNKNKKSHLAGSEIEKNIGRKHKKTPPQI